jgi:hypothetical protein
MNLLMIIARVSNDNYNDNSQEFNENANDNS